jgi:carboxymethylenebutenolidase
MPGQFIKIDVEGRPVDAYLAMPSGPGPHPGVVVAMHIFGVGRFVQGTCDDLADAGYAAIAPYLFHRSDVLNSQLVAYGFEDPKLREMAEKLKESLTDHETIIDMLTAAENLLDMPEVGGPLGVTGFCIGGRIAYMMAVRTDEFSACADFYGQDLHLEWGPGPAPFELTADLSIPLAGFFGNDDHNPTKADVDRFHAELFRLGKPHEFHRYDGAGHAFNNFTNPVRWRLETAADSWEKLIAFFDRTLKTAALA